MYCLLKSWVLSHSPKRWEVERTSFYRVSWKAPKEVIFIERRFKNEQQPIKGKVEKRKTEGKRI